MSKKEELSLNKLAAKKKITIQVDNLMVRFISSNLLVEAYRLNDLII